MAGAAIAWPIYLQIAFGALVAGMRTTAESEVLFEGYACTYHKAPLRAYASIALPVTGQFQLGAVSLVAQGHSFTVWRPYGCVSIVLITHGPPYGFGDLTTEGRHIGCKDLLTFVTLIALQAHIFGHVHEAAGVSTNTRTTFVNGSRVKMGIWTTSRGLHLRIVARRPVRPCCG
jgi:hypothetical protein